MKIITDEEALLWCNQIIEMIPDNIGRIHFAGEAARFWIDLSGINPKEILAIARSLTLLGCHNIELFRGALVWIRSAGEVGVLENEQIAWNLLERFRQSFGETRSLETVRAHIFRWDEADDMAAVLSICLLADWDIEVINPEFGWILNIDHDERGLISCISSDIETDIRESLRHYVKIREYK